MIAVDALSQVHTISVDCDERLVSKMNLNDQRGYLLSGVLNSIYSL